MIKILTNQKLFLLRIILITAMLIVCNYLQENSTLLFKHIISSFIILYMIYNLFLKNYTSNIYITLFYFCFFSLYPRVLYDDSFNFINYFAGFYKLIIVTLFICSIGKINFNNNRYIYYLFSLQIFSLIVGLVLFQNYRYFIYDFQYLYIIYSPFLILLVDEKRLRIFDLDGLLSFLNVFSISFVFYNLYLFFVVGIQIDLNGSLFITFGPINLFIFIVLFYFSLVKKGYVKILTIISLLLFIPIKALSINTQELLIICLLFLFYFYYKKKIYANIFILFFLATILSIDTSIKTGNLWLDLKLNQLLSINPFSTENVLSNSLHIRLLEFQLITEQILTNLNVFVGKGLGGIIYNSNYLLFDADLNVSTYVEEQIKSGEIHNLHESIFKYLLTYGLLGLILVISIYKYFYFFLKYLTNQRDKLFYFSLIIMSFYFYGWSYRFVFIINFIMVVFISYLKKNKSLNYG